MAGVERAKKRGLGRYQALEYTVIQRLLLRTTMPHLLVVVVKTGPVSTEFGEAVFVYIVQPGTFPPPPLHTH